MGGRSGTWVREEWDTFENQGKISEHQNDKDQHQKINKVVIFRPHQVIVEQVISGYYPFYLLSNSHAVEEN